MTFIETPSGRGLRPTASISCRRIAGAKVLRAAVLKAWRLSWSKAGALRALEIRCRRISSNAAARHHDLATLFAALFAAFFAAIA